MITSFIWVTRPQTFPKDPFLATFRIADDPSSVSVGGLHMLGADTDTDKARAKPTRERRTLQQSDGPRWTCGSRLTDVSADLPANDLLQPLRDTRGECPTPLHFREIVGGDSTFA